MALPKVNISFANGALGVVAASADGVTGMIVGVGSSSALAHNQAHKLTSLSDLLGIAGFSMTNDALVYQCVSQFYEHAGNGAELWLMVADEDMKFSALLDKDATLNSDQQPLTLVRASGRRIRTLVATGFAGNGASTAGFDSDIATATDNAQALAEQIGETDYCPLLILLEGKGYVDSTGYGSLAAPASNKNNNRVAVVVGTVLDGQSTPQETGSLAAIVAGRIAAIPVQRHIGRVRDGELKIAGAKIGSAAVEDAHVETLVDTQYITLTTHVGRSGFYIADDPLRSAPTDDYHSVALRRTVDKAFRIAHDTLLDYLNDEIPVTAEGKIPASLCKSMEASVVSAIARQMTASGNLATDPADPNDLGVTCFVDPESNIVATSRLDVELRVRPYGHSKYIQVSLGFQAVS